MAKKASIIFSLMLLGVLGRLMPHLPNATPIAAVALAASRYLGRAWSVIIPLAAMLITDSIIGFYDVRILLSVYVSFALIGGIGWVLRGRQDVGTSLLVILSASLLFFLITNFAVWFFSPWYEKSLSGLLYCYLLGLPFMRNMLLGDLLFSAVLLGNFYKILIPFSLRCSRFLRIRSIAN